MTTPEPHAEPLSVTVPEIRALAAAWAHDLPALAADMYEFLAARIPAARADDEIAGLTLASCSGNIEAVLSMIRLGIPASATEAPVAALEHARKMAARPGGVDDTLRFYRLGHAYFWSRWSSALVEAVPDRDRLVVAMRETAAFVFDYIDSVSARVAAEHIAERERRQRRAATLRRDVVRALLAGEPVDPHAAERALGHPLAGAQLAFVCWTDGDPSMLERVAHAVAEALGASRALLVEDGPAALGGWITVSHQPPQERMSDSAPANDGERILAISRAVRRLGEPVHVTIGRPASGIEGFRASRRQADRTRRIVTLTGTPAPSVLAFSDVELVDLLAADLDAARAFVAHQLGPLGGRSTTAANAREAMLIVTSPGGGVAEAARRLNLHRNTVLQRVHRGGELRGRPATEDARELNAALLLRETLGAALAGDPPG